MNNKQSTTMRTVDGDILALEKAAIQAHLRDLLFSVEVVQHYRNPRATNIEIVYTFPLPSEAVLLDLSVRLGERVLRGVAVEKRQAEERYEDAVSEGHTAILLQQVGNDGLYTLNLGNLLAGETAEIRFRYALLARWSENRLRLLLPTVLAPRYGDAERQAGLPPHQVPAVSPSAEYPLELTVAVEGLLAQSRVSSPSHTLAVRAGDETLDITLAEPAFLDRDVVLDFEAEEAASSAAVAVTGELETVVLASFRPQAPESYRPEPLALKLLVDCSGSMAGDSITQARAGLAEILAQLDARDEFSLTVFGNMHRHLFGSLKKASAYNLDRARSVVERLEANLGGTEMERALETVLALPGNREPQDVLLITDGEIWNVESLIERAKISGQRVFVVGVSSAVPEGFLRRLAEETGGALELVAPREAIAETVLAQFRRLRAPRAERVEVAWPGKPVWTTPLPRAVFAGDTLHLFAGFDRTVEGEIGLRLIYGEDQVTEAVALQADGSGLAADLPRVAAARRLTGLTDEAALSLALEHRLISRQTHYLVVADRPEGEKAMDLPELAAVPQMLAAGWGGTGSVLPTPSFGADSAYVVPSVGMGSGIRFSLTTVARPGDFIDTINYRHTGWLSFLTPAVSSLQQISSYDLPREILTTLQELIEAGWPEKEVVLAFLEAMQESSLAPLLNRNAIRAIRKAWTALEAGDMLKGYFRLCLEGVTEEDWHWPDDLPLPDVSSIRAAAP